MERLTKLAELLRRNAELSNNLEEERGSDFLSAVNRNCHGPAIGMIPSLMTSSRSRKGESEDSGDALEIARRGARH
jgi:hypothetical protein